MWRVNLKNLTCKVNDFENFPPFTKSYWMSSTFNDSFLKERNPDVNENTLRIAIYDYNSSMKKITNIERIFRYTHIRELSLIGHNINSIKNITSLLKLKKINLSWNSISDFTPLTKLIDLETIILNNNKISSIPHTIKQLKSLKFLSLRSNKITDYDEYRKLVNNITLVSLDISNSPYGREENEILFLISVLPQLHIINREEITDEMKAESQRLYGNNTAYSKPENNFNLQQKYEDLKEKLVEYQSQLKETQLKLESSNERIKAQQDQNDDFHKLSKLLNSTKNERDKLLTEISILRSESLAQKETITRLQNDASEISDEEPDSPEYYKVKTLKNKLLQSDILQKTIAKNAHKEIKKVNHEKQLLQNKIEELELFKADAIRTIAALNQNNQNLKTELSNTKLEFEQKNANFLEEFAKMRILLGDQYNHLSSISIENEERLRDELKTNNEMYQLETQIQNLKSDKQTAQILIDEINDQHSEEKQKLMDKYAAKFKQQEMTINELKQKLEEATEQAINENKAKEKLERKLKRLYDVYEKLKEMRDGELKETEKTKENLDEMIKKLKENEEKMKKIEISKQTDDEIFNTLARKHKDMEKKFNQLLDADSANKVLIKNMEKLEKIIGEKEKKIENLEAEKDKIQDESDKIRQENFKLKMRNQELSDIESSCKENIKLLEDKNKENEAKIESIKNELQNKNKVLDDVNRKMQGLESDKIKLNSENSMNVNKLNDIKSNLADLQKVTDNPRFNSLTNAEKAGKIIDAVNEILNGLGLPEIKHFMTMPKLRMDLYPEKSVVVASESETLLQKQRRILNAVRKELTTFPNIGSFSQPTEDDIEGQLDQLHKLVSIIKSLFEQRERNIAEMNEVVARQHKTVMDMSQSPNISSVLESDKNFARAKEIMDRDRKLNK